MGVPLCKRRRREIILLMIGLDDAGKTSTTKHLLREDPDDVVPTVGFSRAQFNECCFRVTLYDLGGGSKIRAIWKNYYCQAHGVVLVVDAAAPQRVQESKDVMANVLQDPRIKGKPVLVLFNKQDKEGAVDESELCAMLNLESMVNEHRCPTKVESCCASRFANQRRKRDPGIERGFQWLVGHIARHYVEIENRVRGEREVQRILDEEERERRLQRVRKSREERERRNTVKNGIMEERDDRNGNIVGHDVVSPERDSEDTDGCAATSAGERTTNTPDGARIIHVSPAQTADSRTVSEKGPDTSIQRHGLGQSVEVPDTESHLTEVAL